MEFKSDVSSSIAEKTSFSTISNEVRLSSSGSGESLIELLKEVVHSSEKLAEILDRTSKFSSDKSKSLVAPSSKESAKSPTTSNSKGSAIEFYYLLNISQITT